jgi:hypothetical protein
MARSAASTVVIVAGLIVLVVALALHFMGASPFGWMDGLRALHGGR